jgi:hypothetical protein
VAFFRDSKFSTLEFFKKQTEICSLTEWKKPQIYGQPFPWGTSKGAELSNSKFYAMLCRKPSRWWRRANVGHQCTEWPMTCSDQTPTRSWKQMIIVLEDPGSRRCELECGMIGVNSSHCVASSLCERTISSHLHGMTCSCRE